MSDYAERVEYAKALEQRMRQVRDAIEVEAALRDGAAFRMVIDALYDDSNRAMIQLVNCDPHDVGQIAALQAQARIAQIVRDTIQGILDRGAYAEKSLQDEDTGRV